MFFRWLSNFGPDSEEYPKLKYFLFSCHLTFPSRIWRRGGGLDEPCTASLEAWTLQPSAFHLLTFIPLQIIYPEPFMQNTWIRSILQEKYKYTQLQYWKKSTIRLRTEGMTDLFWRRLAVRRAAGPGRAGCWDSWSRPCRPGTGRSRGGGARRLGEEDAASWEVRRTGSISTGRKEGWGGLTFFVLDSNHWFWNERFYD